MNKELEAKAKAVLEAREEVKLAYFFGSQARSDAGPLSDYDFAVYFGGVSKAEAFNLKLAILNELSRALGTDAVDLVVLDNIDAPELGYQIVSEGRILVDREPYKVIIEPRLMSAYFDFKAVRNGVLV
ncbi:MAG TPA: nucleotidyltransferase [Candidatus Yonathbacteria bacterium]|nr:nucleotidyltransferase [Candidatus Yonathbacteria bacterium]